LNDQITLGKSSTAMQFEETSVDTYQCGNFREDLYRLSAREEPKC